MIFIYMQSKPVYFKGIKVGNIIGDMYRTPRTFNHLFRKYRGFGLSKSVINHLKNNGVKHVVIVYMGKKGDTELVSELDKWMEGEIFVFSEKGESADVQYILPVDKMHVGIDSVGENDPLKKFLREAREIDEKRAKEEKDKKINLYDFF